MMRFASYNKFVSEYKGGNMNNEQSGNFKKQFYVRRDLILDYMFINKISKKDFCEKCGISPTVLRKILNGDVNIFMNTLYKISRALNVEMNKLIEK